MSGLSWLQEEAVKPIDQVPEGLELPQGGEFLSGIVALWKFERMLSFMGEPGVDIRQAPFNFAPDMVQKLGQQDNARMRFYWKLANRTEAEFAAKELKPPFVGERLVITASTDTVLGWDNVEKGPKTWASPMIEAVEVAGPTAKSGKALHYVLLPSFVQAVAQFMGKLAQPVYPYESLKDINPDLIDWSFYEQMWGQAKSREYPLTSTLGDARAKLWAALGEGNPMAWQRGGDAKFATVSPDLSAILGVLYRGIGSEPISMWARLVRVPDPNPEAVSKTAGDDGKNRHFTIPMIAEVFGSEEEAREALGGTAAAAEVNDPNQPPLPEGWAQYGREVWIESVTEFMTTNKIDKDTPEGMRNRIVKSKEAWIKDNLSTSVDAINAWIKYILS